MNNSNFNRAPRRNYDSNSPVSQNQHCSVDNCENFPIAMAYVPWQCFDSVYDLDKAFRLGTIFPSLDKPFLGRSGCK